MKVFRDQMNRAIRLGAIPRRIVSLVPSQTELLFDLGLGDRVVGITKFCIHPDEWFKSKNRVGGTKNVSVEKVLALQPDLIIGNKEENDKSTIEELEKIAPVWMSDIVTLEDSIDMIQKLGELLDIENQSNEIIHNLNEEFSKLEDFITEKRDSTNKKTVSYFIWKNPDLVAGKQTFIDEMLQKCGLVNYTNITRYPEFESTTNSPDVIFLSSEPFPFKEKERLEFQEKYPSSIIQIVDGEMFSWYGSRLLKAPEYFIKLLKELAY